MYQMSQTDQSISVPPPQTSKVIVKPRILVIGSGGREHAIIKALLKNTNKIEIICFGTSINPGILKKAVLVQVDITNKIDVINEIAKYRFDFQFAIVGPEDPIALGVVNEIESRGIPCIAPTSEFAQIESNKQFCCFSEGKFNFILLH